VKIPMFRRFPGADLCYHKESRLLPEFRQLGCQQQEICRALHRLRPNLRILHGAHPHRNLDYGHLRPTTPACPRLRRPENFEPI